MKKVSTKKKQRNIIWLALTLVVVVVGGVLFVGAVSGWFGKQKVVLDAEYYNTQSGFTDLTAREYEELVGAKKSFVVFVDQGGCTTADRLREYVGRYMEEAGVSVYRMMFAEVKESSLHEFVKYYPSVVIVSRGQVVAYLRADSDDDAKVYNNYEDLEGWMKRFL